MKRNYKGELAIAEAELAGLTESILKQAANILKAGKKLQKSEISAIIRDLPDGVAVPPTVLNHIADMLDGKRGKGRGVSLYSSVDEDFIYPEIRDTFIRLKKEYGYSQDWMER